MDKDIYLAYFVLYGVYDNNGSKVTDLIINNTKRPDYLTDSQGIVVHVMNLKTRHMEIIKPNDDDDLKYLSPSFDALSEIDDIRHIYIHDWKPSGLSYSQLIKYAAEDFSRNGCMQLEMKHQYKNIDYLSELTFKNTLKLGNESWDCIVRQYNSGGDECCQMKTMIKKDTVKLSDNKMSELLDLDLHEELDVKQNKIEVKVIKDDNNEETETVCDKIEVKVIKIKENEKIGCELSENDKNRSVQIHEFGCSDNLRSIGVYDESQIFIFSNNQIYPKWFQIHIINVKTGKQTHYSMGSDACYSYDKYLSEHSNRACIIKETHKTTEDLAKDNKHINEIIDVEERVTFSLEIHNVLIIFNMLIFKDAMIDLFSQMRKGNYDDYFYIENLREICEVNYEISIAVREVVRKVIKYLDKTDEEYEEEERQQDEEDEE